MLEILQEPPSTLIRVEYDPKDGIVIRQDGGATNGGTIELRKKQIVIWQCQVYGLTHLVLVLKGPVRAAPGDSLAAKPPSPVPQEAYWWPANGGSVLQAVQVKDRGISEGDEWDYGLVVCLGGREAAWLDPRIIIR